MADTNLTFNLIGNDKSASSSLKGVGDAADAAARKLEGARKREEAATRKVQIEEARLQELRDSGARNSQILEQEDYLAKTREKAARAAEIAEKATRELEDAQNDAADSSKDAAKALEDVGDAGKRAGDDIGDGVKRGFKKAGEGMGEFRDEAKSTAREGAASFTGEFDDVADIIQETLANAFAGFGPAGMAAGMAAAFGIGIVIGELQKAAEKADESREGMVDLAGAIREAGGELGRVDWSGRMEAFAESIGDAKEWWEVWQKDSLTALEVVGRQSEKFGFDFKDMMQGLSGEPEALERALEQVNRQLEQTDAQAVQLIDSGLDPMSASMAGNRAELEALRDQLVDAGATTERARKYAELLGLEYDEQGDAAEGAAEKARSLTDVLIEQTDAMLAAAGSSLSLDRTILNSTKTIEENGKTLDRNTEAGIQNWETLYNIAEASRAVTGTQAEVDAAMSKGRDAFLKAARAAGMGADEANRLADELFSLPKNTNVTVKAVIQDPDIRAWQARLQARVNANPVYVPARSAAPIARASGGPVKKDTLYRVGEQGEELFVPNSDGTILNANETRRVKSGAQAGAAATQPAPSIVQNIYGPDAAELARRARDQLDHWAHANATRRR